MTDLVITKNPTMRANIITLESAIRELADTSGCGEPNLQLAHVFAPGAYARTIFIPCGTLLVGKIHRHAHLNMLIQGHVTVATEEGPVDMTAPRIMTSKAGTKRVVYTHTDTIWTTIHLTNATDLEQIEQEIIAPSYDVFDAMMDADVQQLVQSLQLGEAL